MSHPADYVGIRCPLRNSPKGFKRCVHEDCAWYVLLDPEQIGKCAVQLLAESTEGVKSAIESS